MRPATAVAFGVVLLALVGAAAWGLAGGTGGAGLTERWVSDAGVPLEVNHHAPAAGRVDGRGAVFAPISGRAGTDQCALVGLDAADGERRWSYPVPPANCTIHAVADPTLADYDGDGTPEVFAATTEQAVIGVHPLTGAVEFRANLTAYGYTKPVVADLAGDGTPEVIVVDVSGTVLVLRPDGTAVWTERLGAYTWGQPAVADFDDDGAPELVVGLDSGDLRLFERDGTTAWHRRFGGSITWLATGRSGGRTGIAVATTDGTVAMVDGREGSIRWRRGFGAFAAVHAFGDGDGDGVEEVYAVARDGRLRAIDADDGTVEWTTALTTADVQMTPPPSLGDVTGDGDPDLVTVTNDGIVSLVDPASGEVLDSYRRDAPIWTHPTLADADGDGTPEVYVIYGDGRIVAFSGRGE